MQRRVYKTPPFWGLTPFAKLLFSFQGLLLIFVVMWIDEPEGTYQEPDAVAEEVILSSVLCLLTSEWAYSSAG